VIHRSRICHYRGQISKKNSLGRIVGNVTNK
jgi:hypothetical protein